MALTYEADDLPASPASWWDVVSELTFAKKLVLDALTASPGASLRRYHRDRNRINAVRRATKNDRTRALQRARAARYRQRRRTT